MPKVAYDGNTTYDALAVGGLTWRKDKGSDTSATLVGDCPRCKEPIGVTVSRHIILGVLPKAWTLEDIPDSTRCQCHQDHTNQPVPDAPMRKGCGAEITNLRALGVPK